MPKQRDIETFGRQNNAYDSAKTPSVSPAPRGNCRAIHERRRETAPFHPPQAASA